MNEGSSSHSPCYSRDFTTDTFSNEEQNVERPEKNNTPQAERSSLSPRRYGVARLHHGEVVANRLPGPFPSKGALSTLKAEAT